VASGAEFPLDAILYLVVSAAVLQGLFCIWAILFGRQK
jgi:hypothetical protein